MRLSTQAALLAVLFGLAALASDAFTAASVAGVSLLQIALGLPVYRRYRDTYVLVRVGRRGTADEGRAFVPFAAEPDRPAPILMLGTPIFGAVHLFGMVRSVTYTKRVLGYVPDHNPWAED